MVREYNRAVLFATLAMMAKEVEANHEQKNAINENETITVKIFDMMENFTKKIMEIENKMENTRH